MKRLLTGLVAIGLFPAAASAGHDDRYEERDADIRIEIDAGYDDEGESCRRSYRRYEPRVRHYDEEDDRVYHHVHRRVHHHYRDHGDHGHVRHHVHRRVHHHYDD